MCNARVHVTVYTPCNSGVCVTVYTPLSALSTTQFQHVAGKDVGKSGDDAEKYQALIWVAPYAHIMIQQYGQAYTADGTHCMSKHGWRAIPWCVLNSLGNPVPIGMAWAPSENANAMILLCRHVAEHCKVHGIKCPFEHEHPQDFKDSRDLYMAADWVDLLDDDIICFPPLRNFVHSALLGIPDRCKIPPVDDRATACTDGGPAFRIVADLFNMHHLLCKKHLYANNHLGSTTDA